MSLTDRLPADGAMGALRRKRPSLYWLTLTVGGAAFAGIVLAVVYGLLLFPLVAGRAIVHAAQGDPIQAGAWFVLMVAVGTFFVGVVLLTGRWVGQFTEGGED